MSDSQPDDFRSPFHNNLRARLTSERQAEQQRSERRTRIQAANDAVDNYLRQSGGGDYGAAFVHIRRSRPDLFLSRQEPAGIVAAANFNPLHDELGRFASGDGAEGGRNDSLDGQGSGLDTSKKKKYDGKLSSRPFKHTRGTGACSAAIAREAIAQISRMTGDEVLLPIEKMENEINKANGKNFDYSDAQSKDAPAISDLPEALRNNGVDGKDLSTRDKNDRSNLDQIASHLDDGPVMVAVDRGGGNDHGELITGLNDDGSYFAYNPLTGRKETLYASQIDPRGVYALSSPSSASKKTGSSPSRGDATHRR